MEVLHRIRRAFQGYQETPVEILSFSKESETIAAVIRAGSTLSPNTAKAIADIRKKIRHNTDPSPDNRYATVAEHFERASSTTRKLALWETLVRLRQPKSILEIGTAYGLSGIAMTSAQAKPDLTTIEFCEPQTVLGPKHIRSVIPSGIETLAGDKGEILPKLASEGRRYEYVFHDGGHSGDDYIRDFEIIQEMMPSGSIYVLDDVRWDAGEKIRAITRTKSKLTCYQGFQEVLKNDRVDGALLVWNSIGVILMV